MICVLKSENLFSIELHLFSHLTSSFFISSRIECNWELSVESSPWIELNWDLTLSNLVSSLEFIPDSSLTTESNLEKTSWNLASVLDSFSEILFLTELMADLFWARSLRTDLNPSVNSNFKLESSLWMLDPKLAIRSTKPVLRSDISVFKSDRKPDTTDFKSENPRSMLDLWSFKSDLRLDIPHLKFDILLWTVFVRALMLVTKYRSKGFKENFMFDLEIWEWDLCFETMLLVLVLSKRKLESSVIWPTFSDLSASHETKRLWTMLS